MGTLTATGLIVGESLWGVAFALIVYLSGDEAPLAVAAAADPAPAVAAGLLLFAGSGAALYHYARRSA
jgi:hypothetical protein